MSLCVFFSPMGGTQKCWRIYGCFQKYWYPKMDGENNGKPENPIKMDDLGVRYIPAPSKECQIVPKGCQFTIP